MSKQMTEQIEKVKEKAKKTFEQISPLWSKIIHEMPKDDTISAKIRFRVNGKTLDITDGKRCVVGEAYGFSAKYTPSGDDYCKTCHSKASEFTWILEKTPSQRQKMTDSFTNHFNAKHL